MLKMYMLQSAAIFVGFLASVLATQPHLFTEIQKCKSNKNQVALTYDQCSQLADQSNVAFGSWIRHNRPAGCTKTDADNADNTSPITYNQHNKGKPHADFDVYCFCSEQTVFDSDLEQCVAASSEGCSLLTCDDDQLSNAYAAVSTDDCSASPAHTNNVNGCETTGCESQDIENEWNTRVSTC